MPRGVISAALGESFQAAKTVVIVVTMVLVRYFT
jgi:hypothetical protein